MTKRTKKPVTDTSAVKALTPKDSDSLSGVEPFFPVQPDADRRNIALIRSLNWYSHFYGRKDAKDLLIQYLEFNGKKDLAKVMKGVAENELMTSLCWLARMTLRGFQLTEAESTTLNNEIDRLIQSVYKPEVKVSRTSAAKKDPVKEQLNRPNIQEIMKEKTREAGGEIEGMFDEFILAGAPTKHTYKPIEFLVKNNIQPQHVYLITDAWKKRLDEYLRLQEGKDSQLIEGYRFLNKNQVKSIIKFCEQVLNDINSYTSIKKTAKKPRTRKAVPVEKQVAKLKYLKEFKDDATKLNLTGLHPVKIHGATEAWVYDTAKRKLHHYIADEYSKTFTVKGNTLLGFDTGKSEVKTLRKPADQLKEIMGSKPAARKYFAEIKAVSTQPNGRFNEHMIILKAF